MMPNFFTYLLLPGYTAALSLPVSHPIQLAIAVVLDSLVFACPVWLVFAVKDRFRHWR